MAISFPKINLRRLSPPKKDDPIIPLAGLVVVAVFILLAIIFLLFGKFWWALGWISLALLFTGSWLEEVTATEKAVFLRFGRYIGILGPGTYLVPSHLWGIIRAKMTVHSIDIDAQSVYAKATKGYSDAPTELFASIRPYWRYKNLELAYSTFGLDEEEIATRITTATLEVLRSTVAGQSIPDVFEHQIEIQRKIQRAVEKAMKGTDVEEGAEDEGNKDTGIEIFALDFYDIEERVISEAGRIEALAVARGKEAAALAVPLKGNPEAARAQVASTYAQALRGLPQDIGRAAADFRGEAGKQTPKGDATDEEVGGLLDKLAERFRSGKGR